MSIVLDSPEIPYGFCQCGCGQRTNICDGNHFTVGVIKGQPRRFIAGHQNRRRYHTNLADFWSRVDRTGGPDACWPWLGGDNGLGYARIMVNGVNRQATHVAWEIANGKPFPPGMVAMHSCDNPPCVNPDHITPGTTPDNTHDAVGKGRQARGETDGFAKLTTDDVIEIRRLRASGETYPHIAARFGVDKTAIGKIVRRVTWRHVT